MGGYMTKAKKKHKEQTAILMVRYCPYLIDHALGRFETETGFEVPDQINEKIREEIFIGTLLTHAAIRYKQADWENMENVVKAGDAERPYGEIYSEMRLRIPFAAARILWSKRSEFRVTLDQLLAALVERHYPISENSM